METIEIIGGGAAAVIAAGAYLRWATAPVLATYRIGRTMGQRLGRRDRTRQAPK